MAVMVPWVLAAAVLGTVAGRASWAWAARLLGDDDGLAPAPVACACGAVLWAGAVWRWGASVAAAELCALSGVLLTLSLCDVSALVIPDACVVTGAAVRVASLLVGMVTGRAGMPELASSAVGALVGFFAPLALALVMDRVLGTESLGGGDVKFVALAGLCVGPVALAPMMALACCLGIATSLVQGWRTGTGPGPFPFGPALAASLWAAMLVV